MIICEIDCVKETLTFFFYSVIMQTKINGDVHLPQVVTPRSSYDRGVKSIDILNDFDEITKK